MFRLVLGETSKPLPTRPRRPEYTFEFTVRDQFNNLTYTAPQTITVTVADEIGAASAPTAIARVTTTSPHPQETYTITDPGRGRDGVYRTDDDTIDDNTGELTGDPGPDEIIGTDDDVVLILGGDGLPCTDDDTLACGPDEQPGTADDGLNLGPDGRAGTADDNTTLVQPDTSLQTPGRRVTLSGGDSTASSGRRIVSYSWRQICLNPDAYGYHKVVAYHDLVKGIGYCGVDVALSSDRGRTVTLTTPALPAMVKRSHRETIGRRVATFESEATVSLYYMLTVTDSAGATYDYETRSTYALTVTANDGNGGAASIALTVNLTDVDEAPPVEQQGTGMACAGPDLTGAPGESVTLQGTDSINPHGEWWRMRHQWTQLSGPTVTLTHPQAFQPAPNFGDPRFTIPADA